MNISHGAYQNEDQTIVNNLLRKNMNSNHFRLLSATFVIGLLAYSITAWLEWKGLATEAINYRILIQTSSIGLIILVATWLLVRRYGAEPWVKWIVISSVSAIMIVLRTAPTDAPESHAMFYLAIVLSLFYFDIRLIFYCTALCMLGDLALMHFYPLLIPEGSFVSTLLMRYFFYVCVAIAAAIGSRTMKGLLRVAAKLQMVNLRLQEDNNHKTRMEAVRKEFIAAVSHELKSPLSLIEGYTEGLKDGIVSGEEKEMFAEVIIDEVHKMSRLVSEMLEVSKLESGYSEIKQEPFAIAKLLVNCLKKYSKPLQAKNIKVNTVNLDHSLLVLGESSRIEQVISNYLNNAIRHTPNGGTITVAIYSAQDWLRVEVENEGPPIEADDLPRIWDSFYRAEKSRNREYGGTGLGLSIAKTILIMHQSDYGVSNRDNAVCFYFTLPIAHQMQPVELGIPC